MGTSVSGFIEKKIKRAFGLDWLDEFEAEQKAELEKAIDEANENPTDPSKIFYAAFQCNLNDRFSEAHEWIDQGVQLGPCDQFESYRVLVFQEEGRHEEALELIESLQGTEVTQRYLLERRAESLLKLRRLDEALAAISQAEAFPGEGTGLSRTRSEILREMGRFQEAEEVLGAARESAKHEVFSGGLFESGANNIWRSRYGLFDLTDDEDQVRAASLLGTDNWFDRQLSWIIVNEKVARERLMKVCLFALVGLTIALLIPVLGMSLFKYLKWVIFEVCILMIFPLLLKQSFLMLRLAMKRKLPPSESKAFQVGFIANAVCGLAALTAPLFAFLSPRFGAYVFALMIPLIGTSAFLLSDIPIFQMQKKWMAYLSTGIVAGSIVYVGYLIIRVVVRGLQVLQLV